MSELNLQSTVIIISDYIVNWIPTPIGGRYALLRAHYASLKHKRKAKRRYLITRAWILKQMSVKNLQSKTQALWYQAVSDDADSKSGVFIWPVFAYFGNFGRNEHIFKVVLKIMTVWFKWDAVIANKLCRNFNKLQCNYCRKNSNLTLV